MGTVKYSGPVASFHCPTEATIRSLKVHFSPKQEGSGDPSPENVRPIVGWDGVKVQQTRKNLWGNKFAADEIYTEYKKLFPTGDTVRYEEDNNGKYLCIESAYKFNTTNIAPSFKPKTNTVYTIIFSGELLASSLLSSNITINYTDGTQGYPYFTKGSEKELVIFKTAIGKTIDYIGCRFLYNTTKIYYEDKFGIFEGDIDISEYEPYHGSTTNYEFGVLGKNKFPAADGTTSDIFLAANTTYTLSNTSASEGYFKGWYEDGTDTGLIWINAGSDGNRYWKTFTPQKNIIKGLMYVGTGMSECQIELGSTATTYEPYNPNKTVYGGWVDLITGEVCEEWKTVNMGTPTWHYNENNSAFVSAVISDMKLNGGRSNNWIFVCSGYASNNDNFATMPDMSVSSSYQTRARAIHCRDSRYTDPSVFREAVNGVIVAYPLEVPNTYHIAPTALQTFLSHNNVWSNADYVEVEYDLHETQTILARKQFIIANQPHVVKPAAAPLQNFVTDMVAPLKSCKVHFGPVQEGTGDPSPNNVRPITGWTGVEVTRCGKNLCDAATGTEMVEKWPLLAGSASREKSYPNFPLGQNFTLSCRWTRAWDTSSNRRLYLGGNKTSGVFMSPANDGPISKAVTNSPSDTFGLKITHNNRGLTYDGIDGEEYAASLVDMQLELGTTATAYEPYNGTTLPIDWTTEAGAVYGGYVDLVTGEVWKTWHLYRLPKLTSSNCTMGSQSYIKSDATDVFVYPAAAYRQYPSVGAQSVDYNPVCNRLTFANKSIWGIAGYPNCWTLNGGQVHINISNDLLGITNYTEETTTTAKAKVIEYMNAQYDSGNYFDFAYKIAPILITTITPTQLKTLRSTNNIWASNGGDNIEIAYWKH